MDYVQSKLAATKPWNIVKGYQTCQKHKWIQNTPCVLVLLFTQYLYIGLVLKNSRCLWILSFPRRNQIEAMKPLQPHEAACLCPPPPRVSPHELSLSSVWEREGRNMSHSSSSWTRQEWIPLSIHSTVRSSGMAEHTLNCTCIWPLGKIIATSFKQVLRTIG